MSRPKQRERTKITAWSFIAKRKRKYLKERILGVKKKLIKERAEEQKDREKCKQRTSSTLKNYEAGRGKNG